MAGRPQRSMAARLFGMGILPQKQSSAGVTMIAPVGGINTVSPAGAMPPTDCLAMKNMIPYQFGLRVRAGFQDWFTGIRRTDSFGNTLFEKVLTVIPFNGSLDTGRNDRLFACTNSGIYDVTTQTHDITTYVDVTDAAYAFPYTGTGAGEVISTAFTNSAGEHFIAACDGANGYLLYRESTSTWEKVVKSPDTAWEPTTLYTVGDKVVNGGLAYICTVGGTSQAKWLPSTAYAVGDQAVNGLGLYAVEHAAAPETAWAADTAYVVGDKRANGSNLYECTTAGSSEVGGTGPSGTGTAIKDGTAEWKYAGAAPGTSAVAGGPTGISEAIIDNTITWRYVSLAGPIGSGDTVVDGSVTWDYYPSVAGANPSTFRFVMQWKNRLWFVPGNSQNAYYLEIGTFAGQAHKMIFAPRFRYGGDLVGLWSWTLDGGQGVDDLLVAISRGGDVAVYAGTNPAYAETFGLKGVWWIGPVPPGRTIASDFGGDLFVLSRVGCLPMSKLVSGGLIRDPNVYETAKVANLFNQLMSERGTVAGWALTQHPDDNLIVINVPGKSGGTPEQLVMSLATKGWAQHTGVPIVCMTTWHGKLFFGTSDGRVCVSTGYFDSGVRAEANVGESITWEYVDDDPQEIDFALLTSYQNLGNTNKKRVHMARPYFLTNGTNPGYAVQARYDYDLNDIALADVPAVNADPNGWDGGDWDVALWDSGRGIAGRQYGTTGMGVVVALVLRGSSGAMTTLVSFDALLDQGWYL